MTRRRPPRRHLRRPGRAPVAACGQHGDQQFYTDDPALVDCRACARTLFMADAELRMQQKQQKKRREV
jgi:hypothetical protein